MSKPTKHVEIATPTTANDPQPQAPQNGPFGVITQLPLPIQVAFQRKVLSILTIQLFVVGLATWFIEWTGAVESYVHDELLTSTSAIVAVVVVLAASLVLLYLVRSKYPFNWLAMAVFSCAQVLCLLCIDVQLGSHVAVANCAFTCIAMLVMVTLTPWTRVRRGVVDERLLQSPDLIGSIALLVASVLFGAVYALAGGSIFNDESYEIVISALVQVVVVFWFCEEIKRMKKKMTPDEYMRGVINFYTDLLVVLVAIAICGASGGAGGGESALILAHMTNSNGAPITAEDEVWSGDESVRL